MRSKRRDALPATPVDRAAGIVRAWVGCYTIGLPADIAIARKEMIEADLWDELRGAEQLGVARSVGRQRRVGCSVGYRPMCRGVWSGGAATVRGGTRCGSRRWNSSFCFGVVALYGSLLIPGLMAITDPDPTKWDGWGPYGLVGGLTLSVVGLLVAIPRPSVGLALALAGDRKSVV